MGMGGTQRAAKFVKYLPESGWEPIVLTVKDVHYYATDETLLEDIRGRKIIRTESLDPLRLWARFKKPSAGANLSSQNASKSLLQKILMFFNRLISGFLLVPDSKILWLPFVIWNGLKIIKKERISIIFTTSPPQSAHLAGILLKFFTGAKLVVDFRDDWTGGESQPDPSPLHNLVNRLLEKIVLKYADLVVAMCDQLSNSLRRKSGEYFREEKFVTITNGYDAADFVDLINVAEFPQFTITHCGSISKVSDPEPFLRAVRALIDELPEVKEKMKIQFFGSDIFDKLKDLLENLRLSDFIQLPRYLPHPEAIEQIMRSHVLLLTIIKKTDEEVISSKVFEYLASGKKILLVSRGGAVADLIRSTNRGIVANPDSAEEIKNAILSFLRQYEENNLKMAPPLAMSQFDRKFLARKLAQMFDRLVA